MDFSEGNDELQQNTFFKILFRMMEPLAAVPVSGIYLCIVLAYLMMKSLIDTATPVSLGLSSWANLLLTKQHKGSWIPSCFLKGIQSNAGN